MTGSQVVPWETLEKINEAGIEHLSSCYKKHLLSLQLREEFSHWFETSDWSEANISSAGCFFDRFIELCEKSESMSIRATASDLKKAFLTPEQFFRSVQQVLLEEKNLVDNMSLTLSPNMQRLDKNQQRKEKIMELIEQIKRNLFTQEIIDELLANLEAYKCHIFEDLESWKDNKIRPYLNDEPVVDILDIQQRFEDLEVFLMEIIALTSPDELRNKLVELWQELINKSFVFEEHPSKFVSISDARKKKVTLVTFKDGFKVRWLLSKSQNLVVTSCEVELYNEENNQCANPEDLDLNFQDGVWSSGKCVLSQYQRSLAHSALDCRHWLHLKFQVNFKGNTQQASIVVEVISNTVLMYSHSNQKCEIEATCFWDSATNKGNKKDSVPWPIVARQLSWLYEKRLEKALDERQLEFLLSKLTNLAGENITYDANGDVMITWEMFHSKEMPTRQPGCKFTFWIWFFATLHLVKEKVSNVFKKGLIHGYISKEEAERLLNESRPELKQEGILILRFSESFCAFNKGSRAYPQTVLTVAHIAPNDYGTLEIGHTTLPIETPKHEKILGVCLESLDTIDDSTGNVRFVNINYLYPDQPISEAFKDFRDEAHGPQGYSRIRKTISEVTAQMGDKLNISDRSAEKRSRQHDHSLGGSTYNSDSTILEEREIPSVGAEVVCEDTIEGAGIPQTVMRFECNSNNNSSGHVVVQSIPQAVFNGSDNNSHVVVQSIPQAVFNGSDNNSHVIVQSVPQAVFNGSDNNNHVIVQSIPQAVFNGRIPTTVNDALVKDNEQAGKKKKNHRKVRGEKKEKKMVCVQPTDDILAESMRRSEIEENMEEGDDLDFFHEYGLELTDSGNHIKEL